MDDKYTKSRKRMTHSMREEVTKMMEKTLDYAEVACPRETFRQLRSKVLRVGNDCMRNLEKTFDNYDVLYTKMSEEIIEFRNKGFGKGDK